ncbi:MAG: ParB/RepB/Spo0J family partition protein [Oscillospiraceae bacterium]
MVQECKKLVSIPIERVIPNPAQPRKRFSNEDIYALATSIHENGLIQPILVRQSGNQFILIVGERRLRAAKVAGLREIAALLCDCTDKESAAMAIIENLERKDLSIFEEAFAIYSLIKEWGLTQEETGKRLHMSQSTLANKLRLLKLSTEEQKIVEENKLTERHARAVLRLESHEERLQVLAAVVTKDLNVKQTDELIQKILTPQKRRTCKGFVSGDIRLFINTIDHAVSTMITAGIYAKAERKETDDYIECIVRIPKPRQSVKS